jgi:hypothetical protein
MKLQIGVNIPEDKMVMVMNKTNKLEFNLRIAEAFLGKAIDDITLVHEHLYYIRTGNNKFDREKDTISEGIKYHVLEITKLYKGLYKNIDKWCDNDTGMED